MKREVQAAVKRVEDELSNHAAGSMSSQYAQFITDIWALVAHIKRQKRRKKRV